jgi:hypothetical protein
MHGFDKVAIELQLNYNDLHYKHGELQVVIVTQKLSCKANYKTPIFHIVLELEHI